MEEKKVTITIRSEELEIILEQANKSLNAYNRKLSLIEKIVAIVEEYEGQDRTEVLAILDEMRMEKQVEIKEKISNGRNAIREMRACIREAAAKQEGEGE